MLLWSDVGGIYHCNIDDFFKIKDAKFKRDVAPTACNDVTPNHAQSHDHFGLAVQAPSPSGDVLKVSFVCSDAAFSLRRLFCGRKC